MDTCLAAIRYCGALATAQQELIAQLDGLDAALLARDPAEVQRADPATAFLLRAHRRLATIRRLEFAAVISGEHNDEPFYRAWSDPARRELRIERFKKPLLHEDAGRQDGLAFLCVKSMLLTGFDAPVEQVLYLDRFMQGHELLQAIARVNRTSSGKSHGLVVDYFGVARHLEEALAVYSAGDVAGALVSIRDELPKLEDRHRRVLAVFTERGIAHIEEIDACVEALRDVKARAAFVVALKAFLQSMDAVLPRPEALPYVRDAKILGFIDRAAHNRYRDAQLNLVGAGRKVRQLIDEYIVARDARLSVPPISIVDAGFADYVESLPSDRARASEMEHAARHHITLHLNEDPAYYAKLSDRLEQILQRFQDNWAELARSLRAFSEQVQQGRPADATGLDPRTQAPFYGILAEETAGDGALSSQRQAELIPLTVALVEHIRQEVRAIDFWRNAYAQSVLHGWIVRFLDDHDAAPLARQQAVADRLMELARARHASLVL